MNPEESAQVAVIDDKHPPFPAKQWSPTGMLKFLFILTLTIGGAGWWFYNFSEEEASKREWSILQTTELQARNVRSSEKVLFQSAAEMDCVGILSIDGVHRIWLLARAAAGERIKIMPRLQADGQHTIRITKDEYAAIKEHVELADEVNTFLLNSF
ncbi:hypothetical protein [Hyphomicrobium sp.]|uniref:hypothetical protein n=1 Tax=Hyphomicrobium sp. TaxID=82 RepID=UPI000F998EA6|nr:hypothetical protein [Hyphomicrobium sp.]RUP10129.1 MAG: hypothetical protein EKK38_06760 [Hyphomicrobium sp.]